MDSYLTKMALDGTQEGYKTINVFTKKVIIKKIFKKSCKRSDINRHNGAIYSVL